MSVPEIDSSQGIDTTALRVKSASQIAEAQLQQELNDLFIIDTQNYLQKYSQIAQSLQAQSWRADIQELYRCIHTIKGGAVTVGTESIVYVATALEDVLADLRYLELAPLLSDGYLSHALLEAGELLTVTVVQPSEEHDLFLNRIQVLHEEIRQRYLPQWNESRQLHQEFAQQGLDLVVLELEIALERLPERGRVPENTLHTAEQILEQLEQIGSELQLAAGWTQLLAQAQTLLHHPENAVWRSQWLLLFQALKTCAKQSGNPVSFEFASFDASMDEGLVLQRSLLEMTPEDDSAQLDAELLSQSPLFPSKPNQSDALLDDPSQLDTLAEVGAFLDALNPSETSIAEIDDPSQLDTLTEVGAFLDALNPSENSIAEIDAPSQLDTLAEIGAFLDALNPSENSIAEIVDFLDASPLEDSPNLTEVEKPLDELKAANPLANHDDQVFLEDNQANLLLDFTQVQEWLEQTSEADFVANPLTPIQEQDSAVDEPQILEPPPVVVDTTPSQQEQPSKAPEYLPQIPVPLEKLDRSAQYLVDTLLALRTTQGFYQALQNQIMQLVTLAQQGAETITHLRQIQDDYVHLDQLSNSTQTASQGPTPERYRQGYTIINRLLETSLRLSEIGAETGKTSQQVAEYLRNVDNNVLQLQNTIEDSRLVPFQNLGFRARAILRDLTTRYNKPAQLVVQGEQTELDVNTARTLEPVLLHLIRNAYDHGLEPFSERVERGKPDQGTITLSLWRQGNLFQFELKDDGRGIDAKAVQARAEALGFPLSNTQTPTELLAVICQPGFSSQSQVNEVSGRGIGMDVIADQVAQLGGRLSLHTLPGTGTAFHLKFPVPRLLVSCVLLRSGDSTFAIPVEDIKTINLLSNLTVSPVKDSHPACSCMIDNETGALPALDLLKYWQPRAANRPLIDTTVCLYIPGEEAQQDVWLLADELLEQSEMLINPLPKPLVAPDGLIGVSLQTNGSLLPVLEAPSLVKRLLTSSNQVLGTASMASSDPEVEQANHLAPSILLVDDAALMRRRLEASLNTYGYLTHTCKDGLEAWTWLQAHPHPNLIITDIEMPNMDGFTLVDRCRKAGITVPILVISSRLSEEWFDEARRLGATDYLTKGFSTIDLVKKVSVLLKDFL